MHKTHVLMLLFLADYFTCSYILCFCLFVLNTGTSFVFLLFMQSTVKLSSLNFPVFKTILSLSRGRICDAGHFIFLFLS